VSDLTTLQQWLATQLVRRRSLEKFPDALAGANESLTGNDRLLPIEQLEIYREQFWLRHTGALLEDFPGLSGILGQDEWNQLTESYLDQYPCKSFSLRDLGQHMSAHVQQFEQLSHPALCFDMARLEWCYVEIFDAAHMPPLDGEKLANMPEEAWQTAQVTLSPAVRLLRVDYPVVELRRTLRDHPEQTIPIPEPAPDHLLLFRAADLSLHHRSLSAVAFALLQRLQDGEPLAPACEAVAQQHPGSEHTLETEVGNWFAEWARLGVIADVKT